MRWIISLLALAWASTFNASATWRPEYGSAPNAVQKWFQSAPVTDDARPILGFANCCNQSERLKTKFVPGATADEWYYYPDPACVTKGCAVARIPAYVIHRDRIRAIDPRDDDLPEFQQMRTEGVLFIWRGSPSCFWPPESGI